LEISDLVTRFYVDEGTVHAVNGVSLDLHEGETLALVGESGSGKSVTMLSVMGLIPKSNGEIAAGSVVLDGQNLLELDDRQLSRIRGRDIAMVFQDPMTSLNPVMSVGKQIEESLSIHLMLRKTEARKRVVELLDLVGIPEPADRARDFPHQFSGGMRQRVMIAMALSCEPKVLIADEPTTALDVTIQSQIVSLVKRLQGTLGMAVIWITHDLGLVARLADRVAVMYAGRIAEIGKLDDIYYRSHHPYTLGLLKSVPRLDQLTSEALEEIRGSPPDCIDLPPGCAFAPRCDFRVDRCSSETPELVSTPIPDHCTACWEWQKLGGDGSPGK
jgi:oligopeptide transport system ATP-binding protein